MDPSEPSLDPLLSRKAETIYSVIINSTEPD